MTDEQIIKRLDFLHRHILKSKIAEQITESEMLGLVEGIALIRRQREEIRRLEYALLGVMHSVDKWLEGDELKQDEVNRAITMREKTLSIVEGLQAENTDALALIKRQKAQIEKLIDECGSQSVLWRDNFASVYETAKETIKAEARAEAIREFAKRIKEQSYESNDWSHGVHPIVCEIEVVEEIAEEMTEEQK